MGLPGLGGLGGGHGGGLPGLMPLGPLGPLGGKSSGGSSVGPEFGTSLFRGSNTNKLVRLQISRRRISKTIMRKSTSHRRLRKRWLRRGRGGIIEKSF